MVDNVVCANVQASLPISIVTGRRDYFGTRDLGPLNRIVADTPRAASYKYSLILHRTICINTPMGSHRRYAHAGTDLD